MKKPAGVLGFLSYALLISLLFALVFIIVDGYIFPDACGLMLLVPLLILSYGVIGLIAVLILGILLFRLIEKIKNKRSSKRD